MPDIYIGTLIKYKLVQVAFRWQTMVWTTMEKGGKVLTMLDFKTIIEYSIDMLLLL